MKKILYIITLIGAISFASCSDDLETNPTDRVAGNVLLETSEGGQALMNGIYRAMYVADWGPGWLDENSGIMAYILAGDLMGEDHLMRQEGQGWFYYDYSFGTRNDYTVGQGRQAQTWTFFYKLISNANIVISKEKEWDVIENQTLEQSRTPYTKAVLGQAYTVRALSYYYLIQFFQQAYAEKDASEINKKGVPLYTEPSTKDTEGKGRGTIDAVYELMNSDIDKAVEYLYEAQIKPAENKETAKDAWVRDHESYIDYYVANGIKARIALAQGVDYTRVKEGATEALKKTGLRVASVSEFLGSNKKDVSNVLWALEVISSQSEHFRGFFSHLDADAPGMYAARAPHQIATGLYDLIPDTDERKQLWWRGVLENEESGNSMVSHGQLKFRFANSKTRTGDYLLMRAEEMLLMLAEAECRLSNYSAARKALEELCSVRDAEYADRLEDMTNEATYSPNTLAAPKTLLEEILFQRRVELWGEFPRVFDLKRLRLGYTRDYEGSNHSAVVEMEPADKNFVQPIPQLEFNGNHNMDQLKDQNPL